LLFAQARGTDCHEAIRRDHARYRAASNAIQHIGDAKRRRAAFDQRACRRPWSRTNVDEPYAATDGARRARRSLIRRISAQTRNRTDSRRFFTLPRMPPPLANCASAVCKEIQPRAAKSTAFASRTNWRIAFIRSLTKTICYRFTPILSAI
jgi:hypothetical protein